LITPLVIGLVFGVLFCTSQEIGWQDCLSSGSLNPTELNSVSNILPAWSICALALKTVLHHNFCS